MIKIAGLFRFRSPLLTESQLISFPAVTKMFQFSALASISYVFRYRYLGYPRWVFPFGNLRIKACLPAPRSLSQVTTSFIASSCQGIHRMRLVTWPYYIKQFNAWYKDLSSISILHNAKITLQYVHQINVFIKTRRIWWHLHINLNHINDLINATWLNL